MSRQFQEPPEKRRKTADAFDDDFWDDDNEVFSQAVLEDIDHIIQSQQAPNQSETNNNKNVTNIAAKPVGHSNVSSNKSGFANNASAQEKSQGYHTLPNGHASSQNFSGRSKSTLTFTTSQNKSGPSRASLQACPPPAGSSSNQPAYAKTGGSVNQFTHAMKQKLAAVEEENTFLKDENQKLKGAQYGKDGQIKMLRTKLAQLESEKFKHKQERIQLIEQQQKEQGEKEKRLEKDLEKIKTMLQFKEREMEELKDRCRRQDRQLRSSDGNSPVRPSFQSPVKTQRAAPSSPRTPTTTSTQFPNKSTFMKEETSPRKGAQRRVVLEVGTQVSTPDTLTAPEKPAVQRRVRLSLAQTKGRITGAQLVAKLVENCSEHRGPSPASGGSSDTRSQACQQGVFSLLNPHTPALDISALRLERDHVTLCFKPKPSHRKKAPSVNVKSSLEQRTCHQNKAAIAQQAISQLLKQNGAATQGNTETTKLQKHLSSCRNSQAVLLLPLLESILDSYIDAMLSLNKSTSCSGLNKQSASTSAGSTESHSSFDNSMTSLTASVQALGVQGASFLNGVEARTICALRVLHKLVAYSAPVRLVLFCDKHYSGASLMDTAANEPQGTSASQGNQDKVQELLSQLEPAARQVASHCDILNKIIAIANPIEFGGCLGNVSLTAAAMSVLSVATESAPDNAYARLSPLFTQESLLNSLSSNTYMKPDDTLHCASHVTTLVTSAIALLTSLVTSSEKYLQHLCSHDDDCLLLCMYHICVLTIKSFQPRLRQAICLQVYRFLSAVMSRHRRGSVQLTQRRCQCSLEVIKCVVVTMHRELNAYQHQYSLSQLNASSAPSLLHTSASPSSSALVPTSAFLTFMHQGLVTLHSLMSRDALFTSHHEEGCQHEFVRLICDVERLIKHMPDTRHKQALLELLPELWDIDMDYLENAESLDPALFTNQETHRSSTPDCR